MPARSLDSIKCLTGSYTQPLRDEKIMLTHWTTNTGEVTTYCFMIKSSATAELSDNRK